MKTFITSLPHATNDGQSTALARMVFEAQLQADGVRYSIETPCFGFWYDENDELYQGATTLVTMTGAETAIRRIVARFGEIVGELEMLFVEYRDGYVLEIGEGRHAALKQARALGGSTLKPNGEAWSFRYASLVAGTDYPATNVTV